MKLTKFQTQTFDGWKGLTKSNHISALFGKNKATDLFLRINDYNYGMSLESHLSKFPVKYYEDDEEITWKLTLSARRNIPLVEARDFNGNVVEEDTMIGVNTEPFYLVFPEDYFADGNVIVGERNEEYPMRVLGDPKLEGNNYVYLVELMGGIVSGIPSEELKYGKKFSDDFSPVERELSRKVGDVRFSSSVNMRNEFSRIRLQHKVAGSMLNKKVAVAIPMRDVKTNKEFSSNYWMHYEEMVVEQQFISDKNFCIAYGTSNRTINGEYRNYGKSGNILQMGAGIREQMSYGNVQYFNTFSISLIDDIVLNLGTLQGVGTQSNKELVLDTGMRGAMLFHKAVSDLASGWKMFSIGNNNANFIDKVKSDLHPNAYSAGFQFVKYLAPMGYTITLKINPMKDDPVRNKILHPMGGVAESYRFDIYSLGTMSQPNIVLARIKGTEDIRGIQRGLRDPWTGVAGGDNMAYDEDSAVIHRYAEIGAIVYNPKDCVSLIPSILA